MATKKFNINTFDKEFSELLNFERRNYENNCEISKDSKEYEEINKYRVNLNKYKLQIEKLIAKINQDEEDDNIIERKQHLHDLYESVMKEIEVLKKWYNTMSIEKYKASQTTKQQEIFNKFTKNTLEDYSNKYFAVNFSSPDMVCFITYKKPFFMNDKSYGFRFQNSEKALYFYRYTVWEIAPKETINNEWINGYLICLDKTTPQYTKEKIDILTELSKGSDDVDSLETILKQDKEAYVLKHTLKDGSYDEYYNENYKPPILIKKWKPHLG